MENHLWAGITTSDVLNLETPTIHPEDAVLLSSSSETAVFEIQFKQTDPNSKLNEYIEAVEIEEDERTDTKRIQKNKHTDYTLVSPFLSGQIEITRVLSSVYAVANLFDGNCKSLIIKYSNFRL